MIRNRSATIRVCLTVIFATWTSMASAGVSKMVVYIGTYTNEKSKGIYIYKMDQSTGALTRVGVRDGVENPSFVAVHPNHRFLYAVSEVGDFGGQNSGGVVAFSIDPADGKLTLLNQQPSGGGSPCHLVVDRQGKCVLVANYSGGSVSALPIQADGRLESATALIQHRGSSVNPRRQQGPHAHSINLDAANRFAFAADLGMDKVLVYRFNALNQTLTPHNPPSVSVKPGAGPRHFAFHPTQRFAYVINEMDCTVTAFAYDAERGVLQTLQTLPTLPKGTDLKGKSTAEVQVHPSGKFLYGSNRGHDTIVVFAIDPESGKLTYVEHESTQGRTPRNFGIDPTGTFLLAANQATDAVVVFRIDQATGRLQATGYKANVPTPVCIKVLSSLSP